MMRHTQNSSGISLVEISIAVALACLFLVPILSLGISMRPESLMYPLGLANARLDASAETWIDPSLATMNSLRGSGFDSAMMKGEIQGRSSCPGFDLAFSSIRTYSNEELGIGTRSVATGAGISGSRVIVSYNSSSTTDPDLVVYDLRPDRSLLPVSFLDTGPGISAMRLLGFSAMVGNTSADSQAELVSLENQSVPVRGMKYVIAGANSATHPITKKLQAYGGLLIIGTEKSPLPEIALFDMATGSEVGFAETGYGINGFYAVNDRLFVLSPGDPEIEVFDLAPALAVETKLRNGQAVPAAPLVKILAYDAPGASGNGRSIDAIGRRLALGRSKGGNELSMLDLGTLGMVKSLGNQGGGSATSATGSLLISMLSSFKLSASVDALLWNSDSLFAFTSNAAKRVIQYSIDPADSSIIERGSMPLAYRVNASSCSGGTMLLALDSTSTPLAMLTDTRL